MHLKGVCGTVHFHLVSAVKNYCPANIEQPEAEGDVGIFESKMDERQHLEKQWLYCAVQPHRNMFQSLMS